MTENGTWLATVSKIIGIVVVLIGLITYVFGIDELAQQNYIQIQKNSSYIEESRRADIDIQVKLREIETHLVYIRKALDE